jgi:signal transduction histidine kinase/CheY-like chemotaxis protein
MTPAVETGSTDRFRSDARAIRDLADWLIFALLGTAAVAVTSLFSLAIVAQAPQSVFLWPIGGGWLLSVVAVLWTRQTRRVHTGIAVLATAMVAGISGVVLIQRGSHAPALVYGLTTIAVVFIAGRRRLAGRLSLWLTAWTSAITWAAHTGRWLVDAPNPLGPDNARLLAFVVALTLIGLATHIVQRRRDSLDEMLERALQLTEAERDEARSLAAQRARMVTEIGHEIRTPMTGIVGAAQLLSQQAVTPVQRQLLSIQRQSAERLLQLVNAVLDQAKIESAPAAPVAAPYRPRAIAAEVAELFAPRAHRKGIEIIWTAEPALPASVQGDAMRVRQILCNLVSNAVKFTDHGSVQVHLSQPAAQRLRVDVHDSGCGIAPHRLAAAFERFVSDAVGDERSHSTGLGLPISRDLALAMGGGLSARSEAGVGSCFTLDLPAPVAPTDAPAAHPAAPAGRLWVVGASAPLALQLRAMLSEAGVDARFLDRPPHEAEWAAWAAWADGTEGAAHAAGHARAQALLVDTWVGHGHCVDLLPAILDKARRCGRRVIVVSSVAQDAAFGMVDGAWQVFRPPSQDSLHEALAWALDSDAQAAQARPAIASHLRILLADDNAVNQIIGRVMLEDMGAEVVVVQDGQAALDEGCRQAFDLILMDVQMPEMDGLEAARRLRQHEAREGRRRTPVVAVTGQLAADIAATCRDADIDEVLPKPYTIDQLRAVVESHTSRVTT